MGGMFPSARAAEQVWDQELAERHNVRVSKQEQHTKTVWTPEYSYSI